MVILRIANWIILLPHLYHLMIYLSIPFSILLGHFIHLFLQSSSNFLLRAFLQRQQEVHQFIKFNDRQFLVLLLFLFSTLFLNFHHFLVLTLKFINWLIGRNSPLWDFILLLCLLLIKLQLFEFRLQLFLPFLEQELIITLLLRAGFQEMFEVVELLCPLITTSPP